MQWNDELIEFEFAARIEPVDDAEAYGRSLRDDIDEELDATEDDMDDLERSSETLEQNDSQPGDGDDNDLADDIYV